MGVSLRRGGRIFAAPTVMATRCATRPLRGHPFCNLVAWLLALVILGTCCTAVEGSRCKVDSCSQDFEHSRLTGSIRRGPNAGYCALLRSYSDCLRATARSCRGHLSYHAMTRLVQQWNSDFNCSYVLNHSVEDPHSPNSVPLEPTAGANRPPKPLPAACTYNGRAEVTHCSLFGDPHLVTFTGEFQTCRASGAWPLVDNAYLAISVTNEVVTPGSSATATTKVTIIIKGSPDCSPERTYEASVDSVPPSFVDGSQWGGPSHLAGAEHLAPVRIVEKEPGRHVEISARHLGATFVVRQVGRYLTFASRLPRDIADQSAGREGLQLCVKGCPASERIDISSMTSGSPSSVSRSHRTHSAAVMSRGAALSLCEQYNVTDYYLDSCIFDLVTTGDASFAQAAHKAQADFVSLLPDVATARLKNRTSLPPTSAATSGSTVLEAQGPGRPLLLVLLWAVLSLFKL